MDISNTLDMRRLVGESGEVAVVAGADNLSDNLENLVAATKNKLVNDFKQNRSKTYIKELLTEMHKQIEHLPDVNERMEAYKSLLSNAMSAGAVTALAQHYTAALKKAGVDVSPQRFLSGTPVEASGVTVFNDSVLMNNREAVFVINNMRSNLNILFSDQDGDLTSDSKRYINGIMKPIETANQKRGFVAAMDVAVLETTAPTQSLSRKINEFLVLSNMAVEAEKTRTNVLKNTPSPIG